MDVQPADPRRLLPDEAVALERGVRGVILAAGERLRFEGVGGGDDQFFLSVSDGTSSRSAKAVSCGL